MTIEELTEALEKATASITKLENKNKELVDREKAAKSAAQEAADTVKQAQDAREEAERDAAAKSGDVDKVRTALETKHAKALEKITIERDALLGEVKTYKIDNEISKSLVDNNVAKHLHAPLTALFKATATLKDGVAVYGEETLAEFLPAYFKSEEGSHYVTAPVSVGTGAAGVTGGNTHGYSKESWTLTTASQMAMTNPAMAKAIDSSLGSPHGL